MAKIRIRQWLATVLIMGWAAAAFGHAPGLSALAVHTTAEQVVVNITFALQDIEALVPMDSDGDAEVSDAERDAAKPRLAAWLVDHFQLDSAGQVARLLSNAEIQFDLQNNATVQLHYSAVQDPLTIHATYLAQLPADHQHLLTVTNEQNQLVAEKMLSKQSDSLLVSLHTDNTAATDTSFNAFFTLGLEHIITGYDHLLFLFGLLLVTHNLKQALTIITCFTLAHSITLAAAGLGWVALPSTIVEPFIAATIMYVGIENLLRRGHVSKRAWLTFGFGLVHGFGFAGVLQELHIGGDNGVVLPLLAFNLGIESGQIAVATLVLPLIWWLNRRVKTTDNLLKAGSVSVSLMGAYWFIERTLL